MRLHASCVARPGPSGPDAILLLGPSGSGKSDLVLRLLHRGFTLVADDQVEIEANTASPPDALKGLLEVRGLGLFCLPYLASAPLRLIIHLSCPPARLPEPETDQRFNLPVITLDPAAASAPERVLLALEAACGRIPQPTGAFAP